MDVYIYMLMALRGLMIDFNVNLVKEIVSFLSDLGG